MGYIKEATLSELIELDLNMREEDRRECLSLSGVPPLISMSNALKIGCPIFSMISNDEKVAGAFGVVKDGMYGWVWMLCTDVLVDNAFEFLRKCRPVVKELNERHPVLTNVVDERNEVHIKWLKWCGFKFINRHEKYGVDQIPFLEFVRI
jgi:hypothetical protein